MMMNASLDPQITAVGGLSLFIYYFNESCLVIGHAYRFERL